MSDSSGAVLRFLAVRRKDGSARTFAQHAVKGGKNTRGATSQHPTLEAARAELERLAARATKDGWKGSRGGFASGPDAFGADDLPKAQGRIKRTA